MRKIIKPFICTFFMLMILISTSIVVSAKDQRVFDDAGLLKDNEITQLEDRISDLRDKYKDYDFVIVTTNNTNGKTSMAYADDYYDENEFGVGDKHSGFLMLFDMQHRKVWISTKGKGIKALSDSEIQDVVNATLPDMSSASYYDAADSCLDEIQNQVEKHVKKITPIELCGIIVISALVFVIFVAVVKSKYGKEGECQPYPFKERGKVQLTHKNDIFVREYTTHVKIQSSSGGGGGSSTHTSSSGSSHGGGGGSF